MRGNVQRNTVEKNLVREIDLKELFLVIKRRLWVIFLFAIIATAVGYYFTKDSYTPLYQSSTRIIFGSESNDMQTLQVIIKDSSVLDKVIQQLGMEKSADALAGQITVKNVDSSRIVSIDVVDTDPERAANIANTTATIFQREVSNIFEGDADVQILSEARVKPSPINENTQNRTILIAAILGIAGGIGLIFLLNSFDETIKSEQDAEAIFGVSVLGNVAKISNKKIKKTNKKPIHSQIRGEKNVVN